MSDKKTTIFNLKEKIEKFVNERKWEQFHSPKNLSMSISIEAAELMELFQWITNKESNAKMDKGELRENAIDEIADVLIYSFAFCNRNKIDISKAINQKLKKNIQKYPKHKFQGIY